jgi:hypothetical protein
MAVMRDPCVLGALVKDINACGVGELDPPQVKDRNSQR